MDECKALLESMLLEMKKQTAELEKITKMLGGV